LQHTLENLSASQASDIVLVLGFAADAIRRLIQPDGVRIVVNEDFERGMGSSLGAGLAALDDATDGALIVLADQPFVRPETYNAIIGYYRQSDAEIVIPTYQGFRGNPVLLDRSVFPEALALKGDVGCRAIFGDHPNGISKLTVDDIGILLDIDDKGDLARAHRFGQSPQHGAALLASLDLKERSVLHDDAPLDDRDNLIIVGTEPVAIALAKLGKLMHFRVTVVDPLLGASELPGADDVLNALDLSLVPSQTRRFVVIASRGRFDEEAIEQAFAANVEYIALVANPKRAQEVRRRLKDSGHPPDRLATVRAPAGLDIGAKTPEEIALSILAEVVSLKRKSDGRNRAAST
jgi:CTP:molybdopterin cytidylyltransferase MocA